MEEVRIGLHSRYHEIPLELGFGDKYFFLWLEINTTKLQQSSGQVWTVQSYKPTKRYILSQVGTMQGHIYNYFDAQRHEFSGPSHTECIEWINCVESMSLRL